MASTTNSFQQIGNLFINKNYLLVTAESCTGGLIGHMITNNAGSSDYYMGGFVTYSNEAKMKFLRVKAETLRQYGAVSRETVLEMAAGARRAYEAIYPDRRIIAVATSGIAGPGGGSVLKPVGTVCIGFSHANEDQAWQFHFDGSREEVKLQTALKALDIIRNYLTIG